MPPSFSNLPPSLILITFLQQTFSMKNLKKIKQFSNIKYTNPFLLRYVLDFSIPLTRNSDAHSREQTKLRSRKI